MNTIIQHLTDLRQAMKAQDMDLYIQPTADPHLTEYVGDRFQTRHWLTGFTGSAGTAVITKDKAVLFTDGRYFIQAQRELEGSGFELMRIGEPGVPSINQWIKSQLSKGQTLGINAKLYSHSDFHALKTFLEPLDLTYVTDQDLVDMIWHDRPGYPNTPILIHETTYAGKNAADKIKNIQSQMSVMEADYYLLCSLNDIAWLFNIRGRDIAHTPVAYAYAMVTQSGAVLYIHESQLNQDTKTSLENNKVTLKAYDSFYDDLACLDESTVLIDPDKINAGMTQALNPSCYLLQEKDPTFMTKASYSNEELTNLHKAQVRDGVAMVRLLHWFDSNVASGNLSEKDVADQIYTFRAMGDHFIEPSFNTIPAYAANAAMMHYSTPDTNSPSIEPKGLFLLDSGGQYLDGTTDITRTFPAGPLTPEEIRDFTLVLKAHIRLNLAVFLEGVTGTNIDIIARQCMWENHMDYKSGTGHSIGYVSGVHEGPARIRKELNDVVLKPGMVITNEPGVYKENKHGIRTENTVVVKECARNDTGTYLNFQVISFCPIDTRAVDKTLLEPRELQWLNDYHKNVFQLLSPSLEGDVLDWLVQATQAI